MRSSLQRRYLFAILVLVTAMVITLAGALLLEFRSTVRDISGESARLAESEQLVQLQLRGQGLAAGLAENLVNPLYELDVERIFELLTTASKQDDVIEVLVLDKSGAVVHDGSALLERFGEQVDAPHLRTTLATADVSVVVGDAAIEVAHPVLIGDEVIGAVNLGLSRAATEARIASSHRRLGEIIDDGLERNLLAVAVVALLLLVLAAFVAQRMASSLARPILELANVAARIGEGAYDGRVSFARNDEIGELARAFNDMGESLQSTSEAMRHMAFHDSLTGLPNRALFNDLLEQAVASAERHGESGALLFMDVDHFKRINDTLGHHAGDELLRQVADRLEAVVRRSDVVMADDGASRLARLGGDEFTVLMPRIGHRTNAAMVAQRMLDAMKEPCMLDDRAVVVSVSIGITVFPADAAMPAELLKCADVALYHAKSSGRGTFHYFVESMQATAMRSLEVEEQLRIALANDEFELYYQPQVHSDTRGWAGVEALIRWNHPTRGLLLPGEFIPVAEETGLIESIDAWVLQRACQDAARWRELGHQLYVAVNVSAVQFGRSGFPAEVARLVRAAGLVPGQLHVELTESSLVQDEEAAGRTMAALRELGVEVWMDDFGTGYSSLSYLRRFPFAGVKIDHGFVRGLEDQPDDRAIVQAVIDMGAALALTVTAEGVESEAQLQFLRSARCDRLQGFHLGRPLPAADLEAGMSEHIGSRGEGRRASIG